jgi:ADP-dependent NAD(P)H-hydrate dehydratase / NAD(P)H-hydrate epimerase
MKILSTRQIREADAYTIKNEPVSSVDLMERAATACAQWIRDHYQFKKSFIVFCGTGNNGGDGLVIARHLLMADFKVIVYIIKTGSDASEDFNLNLNRLKNINDKIIYEINSSDQIPVLTEKYVIIDAILGSGLTKPLDGLIAEVVNVINDYKAEVIAIDNPSGLFSDKSSTSFRKNIIKATYTLTFQLPKLAFLLPENSEFVGACHIINIGLSKEFIDKVKTENYFTTSEELKHLFKKRIKFSHKGNYGHALIIAGSAGKIGAAVLCVKACLRSGAGLITAHVPGAGNDIMQISVPEAMTEADSFENSISDSFKFEKYTAVGIGPGIGTSTETAQALKSMLQDWNNPAVFDADAINILSENKTWLSFIPAHSVFTPHPKEFERLTEKASDDFQRLTLQKQFSKKHNCFIVLKGAHTCITCPDGASYFNSTGNPGMATAGSGDVLTGIITSLLAQGHPPEDAAIAGVYLHGLAGDIAAAEKSESAMIASDIIDNLGNAFLRISRK